MGAVYAVEAKFLHRNNDPTEFCRIITEEFKNRGIIDPIDDPTDPFSCFSALCPNAEENDDTGVYISGFDASYGWEWVMCEIFERALSVLEDGSYVYIEPDNGWERFYKENGDVLYEQGEEDEEDEEEEE